MKWLLVKNKTDKKLSFVKMQTESDLEEALKDKSFTDKYEVVLIANSLLEILKEMFKPFTVK